MSNGTKFKLLGRVWGVALAACVLSAAIVVAGCGGGGDATTVTVTEGVSPDAEELQGELEDELEAEEGEDESSNAATDVENDCEAKEINGGSRKEGTCIEDGIRWTVVNLKSPLKLETLEAKLLDIRNQKSISGLGETATANGIYVTFEIEVTNLARAPQELEEAQTILFVNESIYTQDFDVQNGFEQQSFGWQATPIQPQGSMVGTVTFDVPEKVAKSITKEGNLDFLNFGAEWYEPEEFFEQEEIGSIRTYK